MIRRSVATILPLCLLLAAAPAFATMHHEGGHTTPMNEAGNGTPTDIYAPAMETMMKTMPPALGNADADFMRQMIVHHQAAIDMADVALQKAQDPQVRALATDIIAAQKNEIAQMREWLRVHNFPQN